MLREQRADLRMTVAVRAAFVIASAAPVIAPAARTPAKALTSFFIVSPLTSETFAA